MKKGVLWYLSFNKVELTPPRVTTEKLVGQISVRVARLWTRRSGMRWLFFFLDKGSTYVEFDTAIDIREGSTH